MTKARAEIQIVKQESNGYGTLRLELGTQAILNVGDVLEFEITGDGATLWIHRIVRELDLPEAGE